VVALAGGLQLAGDLVDLGLLALDLVDVPLRLGDLRRLTPLPGPPHVRSPAASGRACSTSRVVRAPVSSSLFWRIAAMQASAQRSRSAWASSRARRGTRCPRTISHTTTASNAVAPPWMSRSNG